MRALVSAAALILVTAVGAEAQSQGDPDARLEEADRLAWLRAWTAAEPHFLEAQKIFRARADERNALYATSAPV